MPADLLPQHRPQEERPDAVDLRRRRQVEARDEDVGRGEVGRAKDGRPGGVVADVLREGCADVLERGGVLVRDLGVDEEVCKVAVEDDHDGEGASPGGRRDAPDEDEDGVREAGETKLKEGDKEDLCLFTFCNWNQTG